jgi:hypothetical protein
MYADGVTDMRMSRHYRLTAEDARDGARMGRLCALIRVTCGARPAAHRLTHTAARMRRVLSSIGDPHSRAQARLWYCEWRIAQGLGLDAVATQWPDDENLRARLLTAVLNAGAAAPFGAWRWLAGTAVRGADAASRWAEVWAEFQSGVETVRECEEIRRAVPFCWLAGTPGARAGQVTLVAWRSAAIRAIFRQAWERSRRTGREKSSRLEEKWYACVCDAFPSLPPVRHALLAAGGMHVDMYWPQRDVALEVQGEPHWQGIPVFGGVTGLAQRQERDARKRRHCVAAGIRLVEVTPHTPVSEALTRLGGLLGAQPIDARLPGG